MPSNWAQWCTIARAALPTNNVAFSGHPDLMELDLVGAENHVSGADLGVRLMCQTSCSQSTVG